MILMTEKVGQGPTRRCDARCYNAKGGKCDCICRGKNHCAGVQKALANVRERFAPLVLCEHGNFFGDCPEGCTPTRWADKPKDGDIQITRKAVREMRRQAQAAS
jgi:hypothetical protein